MKLRRVLCALLVCSVVANCLSVPVCASTPPVENIIWQDDLKCEQIDWTAVAYLEDGVIPMASASADGQYPKQSMCAVTQLIDLKMNDTVTFNCSYSPSSASMDFGVIASSGQFYYINVKGGNISQAIKINQAGSYTVAIRNNSSQTVRVVGFVDY